MILKSPMNLQSLLALNIYSDVLGDKIRANYRLIGTDITSEDLLHMTMQEPALFMNLENNQTLVVENHVDTKNVLKLELVNQLLNRIMLINSPHFTYQDEVFVASILQKMGILNIEEFIQQVQRHMEHNALLAGLLRQYAQYQTDISKSFGSLKKEYQLDSYLHNEIFKRLMTADCNNIMYTYNNQINNKTASESVRNAAWIEQADAIMLTQYREKLIDWKNPVNWQEYMNYEIKPLEKEELTEKRIIRRMAAAVLENIIQKISYEQQHSNHNDIAWRDYTSVFYQSAADVIKRFQDFQNRKILDVRQYDIYEQGMSELVQDEQKLIQMLQYFESNNETDNNPVNNMYQNSNQYDMIFEIMMHAILENQHLQKLFAERMQIEERFAHQTWLQSTYLEKEAEFIDEIKEFQETYLEFMQRSSDFYLNTDMRLDLEQTTQETINKAAASLQDTMIMEDYDNHSIHQGNQSSRTYQSSLQEQNKQSSRTYQSSLQEQNDKYDHADYHQQTNQNSQYDYMEMFLNKYENYVLDQSVPLMENAELLEQINQHNLHMKTLLENKEAAGQNTLKHITVDKERARRDALRALENPQVVLNEIYNHADAVKMEIPEEIERILSITDEHTRMFYEKLLGYRKEEDVIHHQSGVQMPDSAVSSQYSQGHNRQNSDSQSTDRQSSDSQSNDSHMISYMKSHTVDRMIENAGTSHSSMNYESAETSYNSMNNENAETSYSSINQETADISYRRMNQETAGISYYSINQEAAGVSNNRMNQETAGVSYSSIDNEAAGISYSNANNETADISYRSMNHESTDAAYNSTNNDISNRSVAVYAVLKQIRENEDRLYQEIILKQNPLLYEYTDEILYGLSESYNSVLADSASVIAKQIAVRTTDSKVQSLQETAHIELVHKKEETLSEETVQYAAEQIIRSSREQNRTQSQIIQEQIRQEQAEQEQIAQKQLQDIRREQITQSEEHIAQLVSRNLKTQVHTISDMVYLELERRLKNEQRRRGY